MDIEFPEEATIFSTFSRRFVNVFLGAGHLTDRVMNGLELQCYIIDLASQSAQQE